jgi:hypothetical protein
VVQDCVSGLVCCVNWPHHNSSLSRLVVILVHTTDSTWYKVLYHHTMYVMGIYLTFCTFSFEFKEVACLIQGVWYKMLYHHTVVIKEWRDVARDLLCRTILSWRHIIGMRGKTRQCEQRLKSNRMNGNKYTWRHAQNVVSLRVLYKFIVQS